jgi:hypothetical protein
MSVYAWILGAAMLAAPPVMALEDAPSAPDETKQAVNVVAPRPAMSTEQLLAMRNSLTARVGAYDAVGQSWRAPTASEQEMLSQGLGAAGAATVVTLPNGAVALKGDPAEVSYLTVELQADGTLSMDHTDGAETSADAIAPTPSLKKAATAKGGENAE